MPASLNKLRAAEISDQAAEHFAPTGKGGLFIPRSLNGLERNNNLNYDYESIDEAFPDVDAGLEPAGSLVLVMIRQPKMRVSGLIIDKETRKTDHDNTQVAKVIALGPLCFKRRDTAEDWPEGAWCKIGDFVRVPKYQGDRLAVEYERTDYEIDSKDVRRETKVTDEVVFVLFKDTAIIGKYTGNPLAVKAFI